MIDRLPRTLQHGVYQGSIIRYIWVNYQDHLVGDSFHQDATRFVCGFPLPSFQRQIKWTEAQMVKFIESVWLEIPLGTFTHNLVAFENGKYTPFSGWLIDGQQRLTSLEWYWQDRFRVFGFLFSELNKVERNRFLNTKFGHYESDFSNESDIKTFYNLMAFGGVGHTSDEIAT